MVDEAAKEAGYYSPKLYHGTKAFGFTEVKTSGVEKGMDWSPFFAANKEDISASYAKSEASGAYRRADSRLCDGGEMCA